MVVTVNGTHLEREYVIAPSKYTRRSRCVAARSAATDCSPPVHDIFGVKVFQKAHTTVVAFVLRRNVNSFMARTVGGITWPTIRLPSKNPRRSITPASVPSCGQMHVVKDQ